MTTMSKVIKTKFGTEINIDHDSSDAAFMFPTEHTELLFKKGLTEVYKFLAYSIASKGRGDVACALGAFITYFCSHATSLEEVLTCLINCKRFFNNIDPNENFVTPVEVEALLIQLELGLIEEEDLKPANSREFLAVYEEGGFIYEIFKLDRSEFHKILNKFHDISTNSVLVDGIDSHSEVMEQILLSCDDMKELYLAAVMYSILEDGERGRD